MDRTDAQGDITCTERVAVIAIHGVADQAPGATARDVAALLVNRPEYREGTCDTVMLAVPPLAPMVQRPDRAAPSLSKTFSQSLRSDFRRDAWTTAPGGAAAAARGATRQPAARELVSEDRGTAYSDYLLLKAEENGMGRESYEAARIRLRRSAPGVEQEVDVHEMYWADLSRLSSQLPRIVTEVFTLVFRLSRLGRDSVEEAARSAREQCAGGSKDKRARRWARLADAQILLDATLSGLLANVFLQLLLTGLLIAGLGQAVDHAGPIHAVLAIALPLLAGWWWCYSRSLPPLRAVGALLSCAVLGYLLWRSPPAAVVGTVVLGVLALLCDAVLRVANRRFPGVRALGLGHLAVTSALLIGFAASGASAADGAHGLHAWIWAGMRTMEIQLLFLAVLWLVLGLLLVGWVVLGERAPGDDPAGRASVATGRLGLFASFASFLLLAMTLWALLTTLVELGAAHTHFTGVIYPAGCTTCPCGSIFLHERYLRSTQAFALAAVLTMVLLVYLIVMLVPSVLAELRRPVGSRQALGRWLSRGYHGLDRFVTGLVMAAVLAACVVGILLGLSAAHIPMPAPLDSIASSLGELSQSLLKPLVFGTATAAALLSAFGGVISRTVPGLRAPLDVALDVDNHFREFPRRAIPRARIFSRYVALLEHIAEQGYDRVVIVAHSQGTVITTELLRYLQFRAARSGEEDARVQRLWRRLDGRIDLITAGCPLRQLYAARFPHLYAWVMRPRAGGVCGPLPGDVGVQRWINLYTSGDYVGRWLWADVPPGYDSVGGKVVVYDAWGGQRGAGVTREDICVGAGAHTHYFEPGEPSMAEWIDTLVAAPLPPGDAQASPTQARGLAGGSPSRHDAASH